MLRSFVESVKSDQRDCCFATPGALQVPDKMYQQPQTRSTTSTTSSTSGLDQPGQQAGRTQVQGGW
eukprot:1755175-Prorocentrum_lima.AAC.1